MLSDAAFPVYQRLPGPVRIAFLDQAMEEVMALDPRPCGAPSTRYACSPTCEPCSREIWERVTQHMRAHAREVKAARAAAPPTDPPVLEEATTEFDLEDRERRSEVPAEVAARLRARRTGCQ